MYALIEGDRIIKLKKNVIKRTRYLQDRYYIKLKCMKDGTENSNFV